MLSVKGMAFQFEFTLNMNVLLSYLHFKTPTAGTANCEKTKTTQPFGLKNYNVAKYEV